MLYKRIIFGDFHAHFDSLYQIYQDENPYSIIHLGDYFDNQSSSVREMEESFENLLALREKHLSDTKKGDFVLLLGNHDYHYLMFGLEQYSGYDTGYDMWANWKLKELWDKNILKLVAYDYTSKTLYSHAGVTNTWMSANRMGGIDIHYLNDSKLLNLYTLRFTYAGGGDVYGNTVYSSPIWVRPKALLTDMYKDEEGEVWTQIVGHTHDSMPICYYPKGNRIGHPKVVDWNIINSRTDKPILWILDCMPNYYLREWINENGEVLSREIVKNEKKHLYKTKKY